MAKRSTIGALISLDGEQTFKASVQNCKQNINALKSEIKGIQASYAGQANSLDALTEMQNKYAEIQRTAAEQVAKSVAAYEKSENKEKELKRSMEQSLHVYEDTEEQLRALRESGEASADAIEAQEQAAADAYAEYERYATAVEKAGARTAQYRKYLADSRAEEANAAQSLERYTQYIREAEGSTDGICHNLDEYGNAIHETSGNTDNATVSLASLAKQAVPVGAAITLATSAVKKLCDAMVDAAKYSVEVGANFEASMSNVAALSGASGTDLEQLQDKAAQVGRSTMFSASEAADALSYMALAGWNTQQMLGGIDGVMSLAASSGMELAQASDMVTDNLSAFGMQAKESAYFADMLAYAQSHSNTTAEQLGEAYKNSAASLNAAGQDVQTVTSFLEAFANQGIKGSEAGTALSAMMRDMTAKMKDGAITIGQTAISIQDSAGNYRDMTEIMREIDAVTASLGSADRAAALKAVFTDEAIKGVNLALNEGIDKISAYEDELRNCNGTAQDMSDTMQDNLKGSMAELSSATEGLGIALYDYVDGPLKGAVEFATNAINGITDAITPQKTLIDSYIDSVAASIDDTNTKLARSSEEFADSMVNANAMREYIGIIEEMRGKQNLTEYETFKLNNAVNALSGSVPELNQYLGDTNKILTMSADEFDNLKAHMTSSYDEIMAQALKSRRESLLMAQAEAEIEMNSAEDALNQKINEFSGSYESPVKFRMGFSGLNLAFDKEFENGLMVVKQAENALNDATDLYHENSAAVVEFDEAHKDLFEEYGVNIEKVNEMTEQIEAETEATDAAIDSTEEMTDAVAESAIAYAQAVADMQNRSPAEAIRQNLADAATEVMNFKDLLSSSLTSTFSLFGDSSWVMDVYKETDLQKTRVDMDMNISQMKLYTTELQSLQEKGMSGEFLSYLIQQGRDGVGLLRELSSLPAEALIEYQSAFDEYMSFASGTSQYVIDVVDTYAETIMDSVPGGRQAWYAFGIRTVQGLFDAIAESEVAISNSLIGGDASGAMQTILQNRRDQMTARATTTQPHSATESAPVVVYNTVQSVVDGEVISEKTTKNIARANRNAQVRSGMLTRTAMTR